MYIEQLVCSFAFWYLEELYFEGLFGKFQVNLCVQDISCKGAQLYFSVILVFTFQLQITRFVNWSLCSI